VFFLLSFYEICENFDLTSEKSVFCLSFKVYTILPKKNPSVTCRRRGTQKFVPHLSLLRAAIFDEIAVRANLMQAIF
jgi:hypothetical protein